MSALADLSIALVELLEAEGRALERGLVRVTASSGLAISAAVLGLAGLGLCLWGAYLYLATGLLTLTVSGGLLWTALRVGR